ncbi:division/cell wall cluster transcriptional repressor MraZ [Oceanisphaera pacifica]|uniref:Transcriptional regulator MraZ n=1 Tax=Oceanisphaera pacifica TaxID=2818389 RepID=A0ABS3NFZ7_9GAMM|nr:division/cell wall cluster transcriptional repressor MraZ [Oceanisphaera pacifica]MBO1519287.1 division/cell wall cluster transcriptional repressor MraZ [Oceanisphaera pacifica]
MLRGAHAISLDSKGRLAIPTRYRDKLRDECDGLLVCTVDLFDPCLLLYPLNEWELIEKKLRTLSSTQPQERRLQRVLLGHASECELDTQGRVLVPSTLRQHSELNKKIMLVGQLNKFEIWNEARWQQQISDDLQALPQEDWKLSARLQDFAL